MPENESSNKKSFLRRFQEWFSVAFAVEKGTEDELSPEELETLEQLANRVVKMHMAVPAIMFLESVKPLNFVGSQVMLFFKPLLGIATETVNMASAPLLGFSVDVRFYSRVQEVLEKRASIEALIVRIERQLQDDDPITRKDTPEDSNS
jgi:hypothetical protein